uniref:Retrotransposon gag domain-containing protein n=1 Tax=Gasterosteus aculeatus aculeatus TaxID=481459 RepID=A0AAQ4PJ43_GASAC
MEPDLAETKASPSFQYPRTPASADQLYVAVVSHDATVTRHDARLTLHEAAFTRQDQVLQGLQQTLTARLPPPVPSGVPVPTRNPLPPSAPWTPAEPRLPAPERYDCNPRDCPAFVTQCSLTFELLAFLFHSDRAHIAYIITLLTGKARAWATAVWEQQGHSCDDFSTFTVDMRRVFDHPLGGSDAANRLFQLRQGNASVAEYAVLFRTLAAECRWNEEALMAAFRKGLASGIKDELAAKDHVGDLKSLIDQTIRLDNRLRESRHEREPYSRSSSGATASTFSSSRCGSRGRELTWLLLRPALIKSSHTPHPQTTLVPHNHELYYRSLPGKPCYFGYCRPLFQGVSVSPHAQTPFGS